MKIISKQTVYLPVEITHEFWEKYDSGEEKPDYEIVDADNGERIDEWVNKQEGYFFTPEELNEYTANVIKQTLETAAEKADLTCLKKSQYSKKARWKKVSKKEAEEGIDLFSYEVQYKPSKKSITNTFEETYNKLKV